MDPEYQAAQRAYMRYHNMNPIFGISSKYVAGSIISCCVLRPVIFCAWRKRNIAVCFFVVSPWSILLTKSLGVPAPWTQILKMFDERTSIVSLLLNSPHWLR